MIAAKRAWSLYKKKKAAFFTWPPSMACLLAAISMLCGLENLSTAPKAQTPIPKFLNWNKTHSNFLTFLNLNLPHNHNMNNIKTYLFLHSYISI